MKIIIERVTNGYVVTSFDIVPNEPGADKEGTRSLVIEEKDTEYGEQEAFVSLCYDLLDLLGINNSKHNRKRINIEFIGEDDEC